MLIYRHQKYNFLFIKNIILLLTIFFLITSCSNIDDFQKKSILLHQNKTCQLKKLIIPKDVNFPRENEEYKIPNTKQELKQKEYSIFPPI